MNVAPLRAVWTKLNDPDQPVMRGPRTVRAAFADGDPDASQAGNSWYRRGSGGGGTGRRRDLPDATRRGAVQRAFDMLDAHPLANRYVSAILEWALSDQFVVRTADPRIQAVCDEHMADPRNAWDELIEKYGECMMSVGELYLPARVNGVSGAVVLDYFDPADVSELVMMPGSNRVLESIKYAPAAGGAGMPIKAVGAVRNEGAMFGRLMALDPRTQGSDAITGVLAFRWNARANSDRGRSDFLAGMDAWAMHHDFLLATGERAQLLARFMGQVIADGVEGEELEKLRLKYAAINPQYGTVPFTNDKMHFNLEAPPSNAADSAAMERMLRVFGSSPTALPPTVYGDMTEGNRSVATSAMDPAYLRAKSRQRRMAGVIKMACVYAVDSVYLCDPARLKGVEDWAIEVTAPKLLVKDPAAGAPVLAAVVQAMALLRQDGIIDRKTARLVAVQMLSEVGVSDVTVEDVEARLAEEAARLDPVAQARLTQLADEMRRAEAGDVVTPAGPAA
jgi:hypothetical protein